MVAVRPCDLFQPPR